MALSKTQLKRLEKEFVCNLEKPSKTKLAKKYNVTIQTIMNIVNRNNLEAKRKIFFIESTEKALHDNELNQVQIEKDKKIKIQNELIKDFKIEELKQQIIEDLKKDNIISDGNIEIIKKQKKENKLDFDQFFFQRTKSVIDNSIILSNLKAYYLQYHKTAMDTRFDVDTMGNLIKQFTFLLQNERLIYGDAQKIIDDIVLANKSDVEIQYIAEFKGN